MSLLTSPVTGPLVRRPSPSRAGLLDALDASGLTGRGGAAFPSATKLRALTRRRTDVIINACDGELGAMKDAWVVAHRLAGLQRGAHELQQLAGGRVVFAAHRGSTTARRLADAGVRVLETPHRYVSSEETSLINLYRGGLARPMVKRDLYSQGGRDSSGTRIAPTVVLNAETAWRIGQVAEFGPAWFRAMGTPEEPGPRLAGVTGYVARSVVVETQAGAPLGGLLDAAGVPNDAEYLLLNGLGGAFLPIDAARDLPWSREGLARFGARLGAGVIEVLDPRTCPLDVVTGLLDRAACESAGQCGPCMFGVPDLAVRWHALVERPDAASHAEVARTAGLLPNRGACRFPDGVSGVAVSALRVFDDHLAAHAAGYCPTRSRTTSSPRRSL